MCHYEIKGGGGAVTPSPPQLATSLQIDLHIRVDHVLLFISQSRLADFRHNNLAQSVCDKRLDERFIYYIKKTMPRAQAIWADVIQKLRSNQYLKLFRFTNNPNLPIRFDLSHYADSIHAKEFSAEVQ